MTVQELIEKLKTIDPTLRVVTNGYEGGYEDIETIEGPFQMALNVHSQSYYGPHDRADGYRIDATKYKVVTAICF